MPLKYNELMPRVAIENLKLIEIDDLINLIGKDLKTIQHALADSPYGEQISAISQQSLDESTLEVALLQNYAVTIQRIVKFSSGNIRKLLLTFLKKLEISNIKTVLRTVKGHIDVEEAIKHIVQVGTVKKNNYRKIIEKSESVENVIPVLADFEYGDILKRAADKYEVTGDLILLEVALDRAVYTELLETVEKITGIDQKIAKDVIGIEVDAANIKIILRGKELAISAENMKNYLMPTAFLNEKILDEAMNAADVESMIEGLSKIVEFAHPLYHKFFTKLIKESNAPLSRLEAILDKAPLEMSLSALREHSRYYSIGFILAFLNLKWAEIKNLRCILKGSERKSPSSQVRKLLIIPDEWQVS